MRKRTNMYCDQCQEAASGVACTRLSMCGIDAETANLRDLLIYVTEGTGSILHRLHEEKKDTDREADLLITTNLAMCNVNVNFDGARYREAVRKTVELNQRLLTQTDSHEGIAESAFFNEPEEAYGDQEEKAGRTATKDADIRGLRGLIIYALEGIASYTLRAMELGKDAQEIHKFIRNSLAKTADDKVRGGELIANVLESGRYGIKAMNLLRSAKEETFGIPKAIEVDRGVRDNPGILVAGDSLKDLEELLKQTGGTGVDVYTYSDLLSAHAFPKLASYPNFAGSYGGAWWKQKEEFESFNGPILVTGDELTVPRNTYRDRLFTTGIAGFPGCRHIDTPADGSAKDFSGIIARAEKCRPPKELESSTTVTGYGHDQLLSYADRVSEMLTNKELRKIVVMAGSDGRAKSRSYYTDFVKALPEDTIIVASGTLKYRFLDQDLGEIGGIPRLLDAGDASDMNNISDFLLTVAEKQNLNDIGMLPVYFNVAWYDSKSLINILELLYIGMKNIHIGPTSLTFLSRAIREVFTNYFGLKTLGSVEDDIRSSFGDRGDQITADMVVGDIVAEYPELIEPMLSVGLHCLGCGVSQMETLKEACEVHGLDVYDILEVLNDELNPPEEAEGSGSAGAQA